MRPIATDGVEWSVEVPVCRYVTILSHTKTAKPIEMSFGMWTQVGPRNHVLDEGPDLPWEGAILRRKGRPIVNYKDCLP